MSKSIIGLIVALVLTLPIRAEQPIFNISSVADVTTGQIIDIDFHVDDFSQLISVSFTVSWDPAVLDFRSIKNLNPSVNGLSLSSFNTVTLIDQGKFTLVWLEPGSNQVTIPDGSLFFTVEFEVVGSPCQNTDVAITGDPTEIVATEDGDTNLGMVINNGHVNVFGEGCLEDLVINGNSIVGACGSSNNCIAFTVDNFAQIGAMDFTILYDPAVIQFNHFQNYAPLFSFGDGNVNLVSPGTIRVIWINSNATNESLPDGTTLFEICFDVVGSGGQSSEITFGPGNEPAGSFFNVETNPVSVVNYTIQPAQISAQCQLEGFAFIADTVCTTPGSLVCMDIKVNDFDEIVTFEFSLNWDSTKFTLDHVEGFGIPELSFPDNFGTPDNAPDVDEGQMTVLWIDSDLQGVSVPDFTTLFRVCFEAVGPVGSSSAVTFTDDPINIEILNTADSILEYGVLNGLAEIKETCIDTGVCSIGYTTLPAMPKCPREATGAIDLTVNLTGCTDSPTYLWSNGFTTQDLTGIAAGTYTVTITVGSSSVIASTTVVDPSPIEVTGTITDPVPVSGNNGAINITVSGGTPQYSFHWSNEATTEDLSNITAGIYSVTVTDANGCSFIPDQFIVGAEIAASVTNVTCAGGSNGSVCVTPSFCLAPYTYLWSNGGITACINNVVAGSYCVTITSSDNCTRDSCFTITQPPALNVSANIVNDVNENCTGAIDLNVTGGTPPIGYSWSNGATSQDLVNLCGGQYCVTITYGNGACSFDTCFTVFSGGIQLNLQAKSYGSFQTSCNGVCDGEITSEVLGGTAPFTYHWSNGFTTPNLTGICQGIYSLTVTDASGQTASSTKTITSPNALVLNITKTVPSDFTANDGAISVVVTGGVPGYIYEWTKNGIVVGNSAALTNLSAGNYQIHVTDTHGCEAFDTEELFPTGGECYKGLSVITPNDDGKNDYLIITCVSDINNHLAIYNRFGGLVYETNNYANNWNGVDNDDELLPDGGYMWVMELIFPDGHTQLLKGTVNLLRTAD